MLPLRQGDYCWDGSKTSCGMSSDRVTVSLLRRKYHLVVALSCWMPYCSSKLVSLYSYSELVSVFHDLFGFGGGWTPRRMESASLSSTFTGVWRVGMGFPSCLFKS